MQAISCTMAHVRRSCHFSSLWGSTCRAGKAWQTSCRQACCWLEHLAWHAARILQAGQASASGYKLLPGSAAP